jgi:hypothetical protein
MSTTELLALILQLPQAEQLALLQQLHDALYHPTYSTDELT